MTIEIGANLATLIKSIAPMLVFCVVAVAAILGGIASMTIDLALWWWLRWIGANICIAIVAYPILKIWRVI